MNTSMTCGIRLESNLMLRLVERMVHCLTIPFCFAVMLSFAAMLLATAVATGDEVEYGRVGEERLLLDRSVPSGQGPFPILILVHGGGWTGGDKSGQPASLVTMLNEAGYICLSINYRLAPIHRWPACRDDLLTAIRWTKSHAQEFGGATDKIAVMGYSAGGHLAVSAGTVVDDSVMVQAVIGLAPLTDFVQELPKRGNILGKAQRALLNRPEQLTPESLGMLRAISPINDVRPGLPPFLIFHGDADASVPYEQSVVLAQKLKENSVPCELITVPGGSHKFEDWHQNLPDFKVRLVDWLNRTLKKSP